MKRKVFIVAIFALLSIGISKAQDSGLGAGVIFGQPTGVSLKLWTGPSTALDGGVAWSFVNGGFFQIHSDILIHALDFVSVTDGHLAGYLGIGARLRMSSDLHMGIRVPFGLDYMFSEAPVDIFLEVAPGLDLLPATAFWMDGGIGVRYFF
jgi:hypothetical protein